ncbi:MULTISPECIES: LysR family transcriptional regulator [Bacillus]|uniref:HTH-type transcriptional regulator CzcR n=3 Tax=Bacillus cereus TaxID=1396 RepID=A0AAN0SSJ8_BACCE|nr:MULTISPECIES: LysR family transcriptional regulator [Bacillus cereus group]ABK85021.1 transcriptional regulator, LysR family [Bacillus thuringiensis str. Al Hakam]ACO27157.1 transcriptional regulator, LysR family [Bacillus cereus 03BB102]AEW55009.1 Transcriptional regulator, LysR family [Bacillus cereus F837/76]AJG55040.1 bacterial regulatory helix-turn-helix, lysR family protein [Bacillus cereus 03BB102]AJG57346.1 bacterial regulatory helix-turn-helix, lysR family protein [Bacillus cereus 
MTITQLQVLIKTIELGSFTKAARVLNMTQPAVSHAISSIESELGVTILIRDKRKGLIVTDVGSRILVHIREILNGVEKIEQEVAMEKGHEVGTIRIGSFPSASAHFLPKMINHFKEKYPNLEVVLYEGTIKEVEDWLVSRVVDIGIVILPNKEMEIVPLTKGKMVVILREDHPLCKKNAITIRDLENEPIILCKGGYEPPIIDMFKQINVPLRAEYVISTVTTALNMIQEGLGIAILAELSLTNLPKNVQTRELEPQVWREIALAVPSLKDSSIAVQLFIEEFQALFAE